MGAGNVARAYAVWSHLPDREFRLLALMALTALDEPNGSQPARHYFGGRDHLALALGRKPDTAGIRAVQRAIAGLVNAGAIERTCHARDGQRQVYRLNLDTSTRNGRANGVDNVVETLVPEPRQGDIR